MRQWTWLVCGGLLVAPMAAVLAADSMEPYPTCEAEPSPAQRQAAQGAFQAGSGSYQEGDYTKAIEYWRDAYRRDCTAHLLLLNLANAYERLGDKRAAVFALRTYLDRQKETPDKAMLEKRVKNLEEQIAAAEAASAKPVAPAPTASAPPPAPTTTSVTADTSSGGKSIAPWIVVGAGGVVTLVGALVYLGGSKKVSDAEATCPNRVCSADNPTAQSDGNDGRKQMTTGGVITGVGLAGVAGGLVWHFVFDKPSDSTATGSATQLQPTMGRGYAGMTFGGSF